MAKAPKSTTLTSAVGAMASTATPTDQPASTPASAEQQSAGKDVSELSTTETASQTTDGTQPASTEQADSVQPSQPASASAKAEQPPATEQGNTTITASDSESPEQPAEVPEIAEPPAVKPVYKVRVINQSRQALFLQPVKTNLAKGGDQTFEFESQDAANVLASFCRQVNLAQKSDVLRVIHLGA